MNNKIERSIFRAYDIRGVVDEHLTADAVYLIGRAFAKKCFDEKIEQVIIARDGRLSGKNLSASLTKGLNDGGVDVIDIGMQPTPVLYFATFYFKTGTGIMITGSHNPPAYNGLKMMLNGKTLYGDLIMDLYHIICQNNSIDGAGKYKEQDLKPEYINKITCDIKLSKPLKIAIDCGNGVASEIAPELFEKLGCKVQKLFCQTDGNFPNHHPDPSKPENLTDLIKTVKEQKLDLGLAFDGDGDRLGVIDSGGNIIWPDRQMILFSRDVIKNHPKAKIIYDVKCSVLLPQEIEKAGGVGIMSKTGHSFIKNKMIETKALLGGEMSGHIFFKHRWFGFDDALYAGSRLLEIISAQDKNSQSIFANLPNSFNSPEIVINFKNEGDNFKFVDRFKAEFKADNARITTIDGLRADFENSWGLCRASNTTPAIVLRFEAFDEKSLNDITELFKDVIRKIDKNLKLVF
ncbi:MAG: phosphomannomutase/phosphoglucomutase [Gammaproteobacteria bacterium]|nr:MAG: phosphomannomutase/phosphoglucomutase [Gammaproteobacteria bacterium]